MSNVTFLNEFIKNITNEYSKFSISKILNVCKKRKLGTKSVLLLQLPYLSHEPLLEGETKVRS